MTTILFSTQNAIHAKYFILFNDNTFFNAKCNSHKDSILFQILYFQDYEVSDPDEEEEDGMAIADIEFKLKHDLNEMQVRMRSKMVIYN